MSYCQDLQNKAKYLSLIDVSSGYHNLKLDEKSSYLAMFTCQFEWYGYKQLPFGAVPTGHMFQRKIDEIFKDLPNIFGIADDILVAGYESDSIDHDKTVWRVLQRCRQVNLKLNKDKCHFRCTSVPCFGKITLWHRVKPDPQKIKALMEMPPPKNKKELQDFFGIFIYLGKVSPSTASICKPLWKLMSSKTVCTWNASFQILYDEAKLLIKDYACMKFYNGTKPPYTWKLMHPGLDYLPCYKLEIEWHAKGIQHQTTPFWGQSHLQAKAWSVQNEDTVTSKERHWVYCMVLKDFTIIALLGR